ncbi:MAG: ABC transporter substrate-binding protein [Syntrophorhabdales bacterium]|jgi:branched-chain amino acid transport system substrate-binding protein
MRKGLAALVMVTLLVFTGLVTAGGVSAAGTQMLKVGSALPQNFGMGVDAKRALEMLVSQFNDAGGITIKGQNYKVELIVYDDKWTAELGRAALERLIYQDKVKYLVSIFSSPTMVSGLNLVEENKVLNLFAGTSLRVLDPKLHYSFGMMFTRTSTPPLWVMVKRMYPNAKTVVFLAPNDEGGKARAADEKRVAEAQGVKVLDTLFHTRDAVDFTALAVKAKSYNPDLMDYPGADAGTQFGQELKAMYAAGFKGGQVSAIAPNMEEVMQVASWEAMDGLLFSINQPELPNPSPVAKKFREDYTKTYGKWAPSSVIWIPPWPALIAAFKQADSVDPTVIADMLGSKGLTWETINGRARMVRRPDLNNPRYVDSVQEFSYAQIKNGKIVPVGKVDLDESLAACEKVFGGDWR